MSLKGSEIDSAVIRAGASLTVTQARILNKTSEKTWFRQYAKKSKEQLKKILAKVKKGIKKGDYGKYDLTSKIEDKRGEVEFQLPKAKKGKGKKKQSKKKEVKITRKERQQIKQIVLRAPSGRVYSKTEIREGLGSKRAKEYRAKNGIAVNDFRVRK